ncbi:hypothetical protein Y1Q_0014544 [Alligator mississippiensis]|uniref:Uncharacterized protein n=1 Tax=Alligator mississippiensis TaxID=8496 RepID=A0A151PD24_ALLMI|nr:hypothetical protein Y1Q_0014544 [Alligator mississippiensis]
MAGDWLLGELNSDCTGLWLKEVTCSKKKELLSWTAGLSVLHPQVPAYKPYQTSLTSPTPACNEFSTLPFAGKIEKETQMHCCRTKK